MTISTLISLLQYNGNGATTAFPVSFPFFTLDVALVAADGTETPWTEGTQYTIASLSGNPFGDGNTGTLNVVTSPSDYTPATGTKLRIRRNTARTQSVEYAENDPFSAGTLEEIVDRLTMLVQELQHIGCIHFVREIGGTANALTGRLYPAITAYSQARYLLVVPTASPSGAATINLNSIGAVSIVSDWDGTAVAAGDMLVDEPTLLIHDPTNNRYVICGVPEGGTGSGGGTPFVGVRRFLLSNVGGTAQAATAETGEDLAALTVGDTFLYQPASNITGSGATLAIDDVAALQLEGPAAQALAADEVNTSTYYELLYTGTKLRIINGY